MQSARDMDGRWKAYPLTDYVCGETNSVDHSLMCKLGGYTSMRHNPVRDSEAQMREVCRDVQTEPTLLPINENDYQRKVNTADNARLDISARRLWNSCEKTFFDIGITHPTSQSYFGKSLAEVYQQHEQEKKDKYNQRMIDIKKSSFNPLVFTTTGGLAPECNRVNKRLAKKIAEKRREPYASVITYIRAKLRFALLRSTLAAIRGFLGKRSDVHFQDLTDIDFSLIPRPTVT